MNNILKNKNYSNFIILGALSELIYLAFFLIDPLKKMVGDYAMSLTTSSLFIIVVSSLLLLSIFYLLAYYQMKKIDIGIKTIFIFFALFNITLIFVLPIGAVDMFSYIYHARIFSIYGDNPFFAIYENFPNDAFYYLVNNIWSAHTTPYGPLFIFLTSSLTFAAGNNFALTLFLFKAFFILLNLSNGWLIYKIFENKIAVFLYAWNPFIIFEFCINSHNDVLLIFFLLLSYYYIFQKKNNLKNRSLAWIFIIFSVLIKFTTIILLPMYYLIKIMDMKTTKDKIYFTLSGISITIICFFIFYFPFWRGFETLSRIFFQANHVFGSLFFSSGLVFFLSLILSFFSIKNYLVISPLVGKITFFFSYSFLIYKLIFDHNEQYNKIIKYSLYAIFIFYVTFFNFFMPWYYCLLIVLLISRYATQEKEKYVYYILTLTIFGSLYYIILR